MLFKSYIVEKNINIVTQNLILFYGENIGLKNYFKYTLKKNWIFLKNNCPDENRKNYLQN